MSTKLFTITGTTPASAGTAVGQIVAALDPYDFFMIDADLVGATGGTLDVYLQREVAPNEWRDWLHFPQLAAGAAAIKYSVATGYGTTISVVGANTTPALAANSFVGGRPGNRIRALYVAGASTSAGAAVTIRVSAWLS